MSIKHLCVFQFQIFAQNFIPSDSSQSNGHCIWRGVCSQEGTRQRYCPDNGTAQPVDSEGLNLLKTYCSHLIDDDGNAETCCDNDQVRIPHGNLRKL